jgi:hypothetical protein
LADQPLPTFCLLSVTSHRKFLWIGEVASQVIAIVNPLFDPLQLSAKC